MLNKKNKALQLGQFIALVASLLIAGQIGYTLYQGTPFCPNDGCKIVEKLTMVSPMVFNVVGFVFFQVIYWSLRAARGEMRRLPSLVPALLLTALAAEAVLTSFQYLIAQTFCAYCLTILGCIVVLNCLLGLRQIISGALVFATAALSFASLDLYQAVAGKQPFNAGVFASRPGVTTYPEHYLFYASTCAHCEKVITALKNNARATIHFNPIDKVAAIDLPKTTINADYNPALNKAFLNALGIDTIPVLMTRTPEGWIIRRGEAAILAQLSLPPRAETSGQSGAPSASQSAIPGLEASDGCRVSADCTSPVPGSSPSR